MAVLTGHESRESFQQPERLVSGALPPAGRQPVAPGAGARDGGGAG